MTDAVRTPVVFIHGLWLHADSWGAWVDLFRGEDFGGDMVRNVVVQIPYVSVFVSVALWWFRRKDITS